MVGLPRLAPSCATQSATQSSIVSIGTDGGPNSRAASLASDSSAVSASRPTILAGTPSRSPSRVASSRTERASRPVLLSGVAGVVQWARQRSTCSLASPCQMTLTWPMVTSTGSPFFTFEAMSNSTP